MNANHFIIKHASQEDIPALTAVERECFPAAEAASEEEIAARVHAYGKHFWLLFEGKKLIAFVDGMTTDQADLTDDMYEDASLHDENGAWQMIFGVNTIPSYRRQGHASLLIHQAIEDAKNPETQRSRSHMQRSIDSLLLPALDLKMKVSLNQYTVMSPGIRCV